MCEREVTMKKKKIGSIVIGGMVVLLLAGGIIVQQNHSSAKISGTIESGTKDHGSVDDEKNPIQTVNGMDSKSSEDTANDTSLRNTDVNETGEATLEVPMVELPSHITGMKSETEANEKLSKIIKEYYDIPVEDYESTTYYYNYVDLDNDGNQEIFAVVIGPYTSGSGGSSALWLVENGGKWHVNQAFTLVNMPVIISDNITNGYHEVVVPYYGGGQESSYAILKYKDGLYTRVSDSETVKTLDKITGTAILTNDIPAERDAGIVANNLLDGDK